MAGLASSALSFRTTWPSADSFDSGLGNDRDYIAFLARHADYLDLGLRPLRT